MARPNLADAAPAAPDDVLRLLRLLARTGATAREVADGSLVLSAPDRPTVEVPHVLWHAARAAGQIAGSDDGGWRITAAGRQHLRRALSSPGAPGTAGTPAAALARTPAASQVGPQRPEIDLTESPLAWLARRQQATGKTLISPAQLMAGERFRADFWFAGMSPRVTSSWTPSTSGSRSRKSGASLPGHQSDAMLAARERIRLALAAVGPELCGVLVDVCGHLKGLEEIERQASWPKRSGKLVLGLALTALARHYGYIVPAPDARRGQRVQHWGLADYRPPADPPGMDAEPR